MSMFRFVPPCAVLAICVAGPALAQERQWQLSVGDTEVALVFGVPDYDDAGIGFWCPRGSGAIRIIVPDAGLRAKPGETVMLRLEAGGKTFAYAAAVEADGSFGMPSATAETTSGDALFAALKEADHFTLIDSAHATVFPLIEADMSGLLRLCAKT